MTAMRPMRLNDTVLFYGGTLLSSIGSMTFNVALMAFMITTGYSLLQVSLIIGLQRLLPAIAAFFLGDLTDRLPPRTVVLVTEVAAAIGTLGILWAWNLGPSGYSWLLGFCLVKSAGLQFQSSSRAVISKLLSTEQYSSNAKNAMWLNTSTQGATLFAGGLGFVAVKFLSLEWAIWFDMATFLVSGVCVAFIRVGTRAQHAPQSSETSRSILAKFGDFYRFNPRSAVLDALLAVAMLGSASFRTRVAGDHQDWNPIFLLSYGIAVWLSKEVESSGALKARSTSLWVTLATAFILLGYFPERGWLTFGIFLVRDTCYWLILHRVSSYIQTDTPASVTGSVNAARTFQMIVILSAGEVLVGAWQSFLPLYGEALFRACVCFGVGGFVWLTRATPRLGYERPHL